MYFVAFDNRIRPPFADHSMTFRAERLVTQLLVDADPDYLAKVVETGRLADAIMSEVAFIGAFPNSLLPKVSHYLHKQAKAGALAEIAERLARHPGDVNFREFLSKPTAEPSPEAMQYM